MLAKQQMKMAFCLASFADCGGDAEMSVTKALEVGNENVDKSMELFKAVSLHWSFICLMFETFEDSIFVNAYSAYSHFCYGNILGIRVHFRKAYDKIFKQLALYISI